MIQEVFETIRSIDKNYSAFTAMRCNKMRELAIKMINGDILSADEEQFLLTIKK